MVSARGCVPAQDVQSFPHAAARVAQSCRPSVLAAQARLRSSADFASTVKRGVRAGGSTVVVHARLADTTSASSAEGITRPPANTQVGFVVSKRVGNAVTRNRVKRRLRHMCRKLLADEDASSAAPASQAGLRQIVVRALPDAAKLPELVEDDLAKTWSRAERKLVARQNR